MRIRQALLIGALSFASAGAAQAQRAVVVNGQLLSPVQLAQLDAMHCAWVPNGRYWVNLQTGAWGYAGSSVRRGFVGDPCRAGRSHQGLSQRGRLFRPGEILNGR